MTDFLGFIETVDPVGADIIRPPRKTSSLLRRGDPCGRPLASPRRGEGRKGRRLDSRSYDLAGSEKSRSLAALSSGRRSGAVEGAGMKASSAAS